MGTYVLMDERDLEPLLFEYAELDGERMTATMCRACQARGLLRGPEPMRKGVFRLLPCPTCDGTGCQGIDPTLPTIAPPGSMERVFVLAARYAAGLPLWHPYDEPTQRAGTWRMICESKQRCRFLPLSNPDSELDEPGNDFEDYDDLCE